MASVLGSKFKEAGHTILQIYSRNAASATQLAYEWDTESTNYISLINKEADIYIIAVPDNIIPSLVPELKFPGKIIVHTAASVPMEILSQVSEHFGVFYPLQSLSKGMLRLPEIPFFIEGSDDFTRKKLELLAHSISPLPVAEAGADTRQKLHVAAVFVNNFVNHLYVLAEDYCRKEGLDFRQLIPLIFETGNKVNEKSPAECQTGPAVRHDGASIQKHLELLNKHPHLKNIYLLMTESIQQSS